MTNRQFATVTSVELDRVKVRFSQDEESSELEYLKLKSYDPEIGDRVLMIRTNTSFVCLGAIG